MKKPARSKPRVVGDLRAPVNAFEDDAQRQIEYLFSHGYRDSEIRKKFIKYCGDKGLGCPTDSEVENRIEQVKRSFRELTGSIKKKSGDFAWSERARLVQRSNIRIEKLLDAMEAMGTSRGPAMDKVLNGLRSEDQWRSKLATQIEEAGSTNTKGANQVAYDHEVSRANGLKTLALGPAEPCDEGPGDSFEVDDTLSDDLVRAVIDEEG